MADSEFAEHWSHAQFCYFRAEAAKSPVLKQLWIQLAQDWIALSQNLGPATGQQNFPSMEGRIEPPLVA